LQEIAHNPQAKQKNYRKPKRGLYAKFGEAEFLFMIPVICSIGKATPWGACDKAVFCINECKVLLYLFNNKLIIEKKKNYAIIKS
jgi:hypothetical protein